jgi:hypothetical protein
VTDSVPIVVHPPEMDAGPSRQHLIVDDDEAPSAVGSLDPLAVHTNTITQIVPDVLPSHARQLVETHLPAFGNEIVQAVVNMLFEDPNTYPKLDRKGKGKRERENEVQEEVKRNVKVKVDYASADRPHNGGEHYTTLAMVIYAISIVIGNLLIL